MSKPVFAPEHTLAQDPVFKAVSAKIHHNSFANLDPTPDYPVKRIWAIGAIHGDIDQLKKLHGKLASRIQPGDCVIYLGNYFGYGNNAIRVFQELLNFRIWFLSGAPYQAAHDIVFLRGCQEEMLAKMLLLERAPDPASILDWVEQQGMHQLLEGFGLSWSLLRIAAHVGGQALPDWTKAARVHLYSMPGFQDFIGGLKRAAYSHHAKLALVHSGFDPALPLKAQNDQLWWEWKKFERYETSQENYRLIVRGYDPLNRGLSRGLFRLCVDGGAGRGGELYATLISNKGIALQWL